MQKKLTENEKETIFNETLAYLAGVNIECYFDEETELENVLALDDEDEFFKNVYYCAADDIVYNLLEFADDNNEYTTSDQCDCNDLTSVLRLVEKAIDDMLFILVANWKENKREELESE